MWLFPGSYSGGGLVLVQLTSFGSTRVMLRVLPFVMLPCMYIFWHTGICDFRWACAAAGVYWPTDLLVAPDGYPVVHSHFHSAVACDVARFVGARCRVRAD